VVVPHKKEGNFEGGHYNKKKLKENTKKKQRTLSSLHTLPKVIHKKTLNPLFLNSIVSHGPTLSSVVTNCKNLSSIAISTVTSFPLPKSTPFSS
jgi:hypothetical protein